MIPSASSTGELTWNAAPSNWADHQAGAAAVVTGGIYSTASGSNTAGADSRYHNLHRHQILDLENAMLLANHDSVYDHHVDDYTKPASITSLHADTIASISHPRHYENLLSAHIQASHSNTLGGHNAWPGLINTVCTRNFGAPPQEAASSVLQAASAPYSYESCLHEGAQLGLGAYSMSLGATGNLYADPLRSSSSNGVNMLGITGFDPRGLDDIVKRELYTTQDFNSRLGLNLGGRTYFSADDFAYAGRWGKRFRPNLPGCMMQPAPLCQAEGCKADLSMAKHYHRRHKVCEYHSKAATVHIGDQTQRFCQQCSRFHVLAEFDDGKRSCRKRLADHNRRRRKPQPAPALAIEAAADEAKDHESQEAPTGSDQGLQNGTESSKCSPTNGGEDQTTTTTSANTPGGSATINDQAGSTTGQLLDVAMEQDQKASSATLSSVKSHLKSNATSCGVPNNNSSITPALAGACQLAAAHLSLGAGATDNLDMKPATCAAALNTALPSGDHVSHIRIAPTATKQAVVMPWLQGLKKHDITGGFPYSSSTNTDRNVDNVGGGADYLHYGDKEARNFPQAIPMDRCVDNRSTSWSMITGMTAVGVSQTEKDALMMSSRHTGNSGNDTGGHELLRLLGDEKELLSSSSKRNAAMQANPGSIGTLAFLDHSLEPSAASAFTGDAKHCILDFSSLHQSSASSDQQVDHSLHRAPSKFMFGNHNQRIS